MVNYIILMMEPLREGYETDFSRVSSPYSMSALLHFHIGIAKKVLYIYPKSEFTRICPYPALKGEVCRSFIKRTYSLPSSCLSS